MSLLIAFSHLRWNFVFQRPQHLLSRLAKHQEVLFIEEPVFDEQAPWLEISSPSPSITVLRPHRNVAAPGFHDDQLPALEFLLEAFLRENNVRDPVAWLYTPMALPLIASLQPSAVIFDCMDELSAFKDAPKQVRQREAALIRRADLVLTGGPSLYAAKRTLHHNVSAFRAPWMRGTIRPAPQWRTSIACTRRIACRELSRTRGSASSA